MGLKHKPFEKLIPEWEAGEEKKADSKPDSDTKEQNSETEQGERITINSVELTPNTDGLLERHIERTILGRVDASTSVGGPKSKYDHNEDGFLIVSKEDELAVAVFDGAGGSEHGKLATKIASETFHMSMHEGDDLMDAFDEISANVQKDGKGGYLAAVALHAFKRPDGVIRKNVANSGDTKILTIRDGKRFDPGTTTLQNLGQTFIKAGHIEPWQYYTFPRQNVLTGGLGAEGTSDSPEFRAFDHEEGDVSVLASDGLWDIVSEYEVLELAKEYQGKELQERIFELAFSRSNSESFEIRHSPDHVIRKSQGRGDNITVLVVG